MPADVHVHGIEAHPYFADLCRKRFAGDSRVTIHNFAVGLEDGHTELHVSKKSAVGSSIYVDKPGATGERKRVPQRRLSTWLMDNGFLPKPPQTISIIKANIEGAEWDLIQDLDREGLFDYFDLFYGAAHNQAWTTDMRKIPSLHPHIETAEAILEKHGIRIRKYKISKDGTPAPNVTNMRKAVSELLLQKADK